MKKIVVFISEDYIVNDDFLMDDNATRDEITEEVNRRYPVWYYLDIWENNDKLDGPNGL